MPDGKAQEAPQRHARAEQPLERLATGILEHEHVPTVFAHQLQRPCRPCTIEFIFELTFVREPFEGKGGRVFRGEAYDQHRIPAAAGINLRSSIKTAFAVLPQDLETVLSFQAERRRSFQCPPRQQARFAVRLVSSYFRADRS